ADDPAAAVRQYRQARRRRRHCPGPRLRWQTWIDPGRRQLAYQSIGPKSSWPPFEAAIQFKNLAPDRTENRYPLFLIARLAVSDNPMRHTKGERQADSYVRTAGSLARRTEPALELAHEMRRDQAYGEQDHCDCRIGLVVVIGETGHVVGGTEEIDDGDRREKRRLLEQANQEISERRDHRRQGLRQDDLCPERIGPEAQSARRFPLSFRHAVNAGAIDLGD